MSATRPGAILRHLHPADPDDAALLARYAGRRDPAAFAALVRRHGPVVLAVCRRVTGHPQDAEDAFQAAFLVLARSAGSVRHPERLGSWLYGVAVKVAGRARRTAGRRRRREVTVAAFPDVPAPDPAPPPDIGPALHEELAALPPLHREPIVLCDLQGLSRAEAAKALGIAEGTLSSRLANGRKRLADRLTRRGVVLSLAALPAAVAGGRAAVSDELVTNTCGLAAAWAAGAPLPAAVVRLARGGFPMRGAILGGVLSVTLAAGAVLAAGLADTPRPADPPRPPELPVAVVQDAEGQPPKKADAPAKLRAPRLQQTLDLSVRLARTAVWNEAGTMLIVAGVTGDPQFAPGGPAGVAPVGGKNPLGGGSPFSGKGGLTTLGKPTLALVPVGDRPMGSANVSLPASSKLIGFPQQRHFLIETHESGLISGAHTVQLWEIEENPVRGLPGVPPILTARPSRVFEVEPEGALFTPHGEALRYLVRQVDKDGIRKVEVREVNLNTSNDDALGTFEGAFKLTQFTPDAKRVVVVTNAGVVEAYGADGKRVWASDPPGKAPNIVVRPADRDIAYVGVARDGSRVLAVRGRTAPVVLDGATGKALAPLAGLDLLEVTGTSSSHAAVSADGRLAALAYVTLEKADAKGFGGQTIPIGPPVFERGSSRLTMWDTATGRVVRTWTGGSPTAISFHPTRPVLAILEANGSETRLGLWEFPAE